MSADVVVAARGLGKRFDIGVKEQRPTLSRTLRRWIYGASASRVLWALRGLDFEVRRGEILGVVGSNGAGKSTLLLLIAGILAPSEGEIEVHGRTNPFFQLSAGLQDELTVLENFWLCGALLGIPRSVFRRRLPEMVEYSGLEPYLYARLADLSTGLAARLPFSTAVHGDLDILLIDELLAVGDPSFQARCAQTFAKLSREGKTLVVVSQNLDLIGRLCTRSLYLKEGKARFEGTTDQAASLFLRDLGLPGRSGAPQPLESAVLAEPAPLEGRLEALARAIESQAARWTRAADLVLKGGGGLAAGPTGPGPATAASACRRTLSHSGALSIADSPLAAIWLCVAALTSRALPGALEPGDEVLTPAASYPGVAAALAAYGLVPVLVDLDAASFNADVAQLEAALGPRARAVLLPHLADAAAPSARVAEWCRGRGLRLVELCNLLGASSDGRALGTFGELGMVGRWPAAEAVDWGLTLARSEELQPVLDQLLDSADPGRPLQELERPLVLGLGRRPRASAAGLEHCLEALEAGSPDGAAAREPWARLLARYPDWFSLPPAAAQRRGPPSLVAVLSERAPISSPELAALLVPEGLRVLPYLPPSAWLPLALPSGAARRQPTALTRAEALFERGFVLRGLHGAGAPAACARLARILERRRSNVSLSE